MDDTSAAPIRCKGCGLDLPWMSHWQDGYPWCSACLARRSTPAPKPVILGRACAACPEKDATIRRLEQRVAEMELLLVEVVLRWAADVPAELLEQARAALEEENESCVD